ncbi:TrlF family AAA-like ATPase [Flavobacterium johnsoniae]|uniref:ATPase involved in DNA repair n=1 Tax=Flavobacterium johnsoniae (strain ATCC 17061 / DSM 2064 / JCM 8514 / BCRC 14874 / CCUG 350202 / NBRC 14942 / NCIMB 11054 / UW101) TaxID=376686 RepID=A5FAN4_FLAJ1|nr:hypothetical protein [Flavobacterium johnsoniae]ABQ07739.1 hypothetical protein Fjoh_4740 [Flavobacterium johnsoniae UW101]OXG01823.1 hypothetical protein B0A63_03960 [Flavobacterium johnsoniae UW101]WQG80420.1 hypothetical protein SR927_20655 [Flavobacterium johnsoniae UW101]SHL03568.1 hypothetical protein SAMN05444146_2737 [Flavobacterium johnsoniae]
MSNRGSEWRKWNFHVHTKGTNKNDQFTSGSMDDFFCTFFKKAYEDKIEAIGITDYFSIDRYLDAINYVKEIHTKEDEDWEEKLFSEDEINFIRKIFIFPNVELRISPTTKKGKFINLHFIFDPKIVENLNNEFFNKISNVENYLMNYQGIKDYAKHINPLLNDDQLYKFGIDNYNIEFGSIKSLLESNKLIRDNSLIAVSSKSNDGVSGLKDYYEEFEKEGGSLLGTVKSIYKLTNIVFSNAPSDKEYFLGKKTSEQEVISHTGSLKPCIIGCDSHSEDTLFSRFTWVKSDLTFEGLRQICYEPEQRVKIQNDKPDFKEDKVIINKVQFISENKVFTNKEIYLNPNLNVIIGGKSSGKSIFLYSMAKTLLVDDTILKNENLEEKYNLRSIDSDFNFRITTNSGISQEMFRSLDENSVIPDIKYIPQNYLVKLAEPDINKKGKSLNKLVRDLIKEDQDSKDKYDQFIRNVKQNDKERDDLLSKYFELLEEIAKTESELKTKSNKEVLEKNIKSNTESVEKLNKESGLSDQEILKYKEIQTKLEFNTIQKNNFNDDFNNINAGLSDLKKLSNDILEKKKEFVEKIKTESVKQYYVDKLSFIDKIYLDITKIFEEIEIQTDEAGKRSFKNENLLKKNLISINGEKATLTKELEPYQQNEKLKKQIEVLNQSIIDDKKLLADIDLLNKAILDKKSLSENCRQDIFKLFRENFEEYNKIINELKHRTLELEGDGLKIDGIAQFNFPKFVKNLYEVSDGRKASYNNYTILKETHKATSPTNFEEIINEIEKIFIDIINGDYFILAKFGKMQAVKELLDDYFFDYWKITYKEDKLGEMSTGKASFVILMLIIGLSKSKAPILIDQPEDNLDNRSITLDLVSYLKNKKLERQIIIVTHNANIVVNSDAENVIVANQKGQNEIDSSSNFKFDLINGSIENTFEKILEETDILRSMGIREHIADIVEGGKEAFKKREEKYGF